MLSLCALSAVLKGVFSHINAGDVVFVLLSIRFISLIATLHSVSKWFWLCVFTVLSQHVTFTDRTFRSVFKRPYESIFSRCTSKGNTLERGGTGREGIHNKRWFSDLNLP